MPIKPQCCLKNNRTNGIMSLSWLKLFRASGASGRSQPPGLHVLDDAVFCDSSTHILCSDQIEQLGVLPRNHNSWTPSLGKCSFFPWFKAPTSLTGQTDTCLETIWILFAKFWLQFIKELCPVSVISQHPVKLLTLCSWWTEIICLFLNHFCPLGCELLRPENLIYLTL